MVQVKVKRLRNIIGPLFNFKNCVVFGCFFGLFFKNHLLSAGENEIFENKKNKNNKKLDHFLTFKRAKIGPLFNFTAHIYIYACISRRVMLKGRFMPFREFSCSPLNMLHSAARNKKRLSSCTTGELES